MSQATESLFAENHEHFFNSIDPKRPSHTQAFTAPACRGRFNSWRGNRFRRFISSLFLYVDNEVIIAIHAGGKTRDSHAGDCTVSFRTLIFSRAAENGHRSLRSPYCRLDLRRSVHLVPKNQAVIEREVVVLRKRAGAFYVIGYED